MDNKPASPPIIPPLELKVEASLFPQSGHHLMFRPIVATNEIDDDLSNAELPAGILPQDFALAPKKVPASQIREAILNGDRVTWEDGGHWQNASRRSDSKAAAVGGPSAPITVMLP